MTNPTSTAHGEQHDDFYKRLREKVSRWASKKQIDPKYREYVLAVPDMFHLLCRLMLEKGVGLMDKAMLGVAIAYVLSPLDFIPDVLGPFGFVDDFIVMVITLDTLLDRVPRRIVDKHWAGSRNVMELIRESIDKADDLVGKGVVRRIERFLRAQGILPQKKDVGTGRSTGATQADVGKAAGNRAAGKKTTAKKKSATRKKTATKKAATKRTGATKATSKKTASKKTTKKAASKQTTKTVGPRARKKTGGGS